MFIILGAARRATEGIKYARNKNWKWSSDFLIGKELNQANLGILGMGRIGRSVARRARSFGMKIHYCNRVRLSPDLENESIYHDNIKSLFSVSDFLSINCSSTQETKHIINKKTLNYFPEGAVIANSSRGEITLNFRSKINGCSVPCLSSLSSINDSIFIIGVQL